MAIKEARASRERMAVVAARPRHRSDDWAKLLSEQQESGLTVQAFCMQRGLAQSTFWRWQKVLGKSAPGNAVVAVAARQPTFLALSVNVPSEALEVNVGDMRVRLSGADAQRVLDAIVARIAGPM